MSTIIPNVTPTRSEGGLFGRLGTLGRKKKPKEVDELENEGRSAIDGSSQSPALDFLPEEFVLNEGESRRMLQPGTQNQADFCALRQTLINWVNDELAELRIIVRKLDEDLYDGQILGKLVERLGNCKLDVIEVTLNEHLQRAKLRAVLDTANRLLGLNPSSSRIRWTVEGIHQADLAQIIHLLVAFVRHFRSPIRLPPNVSINVIVVQKSEGKLISRIESEQLTGANSWEENGPDGWQYVDEFERLFAGPLSESSIVAQQLVFEFVRIQLARLNIDCEAQVDERTGAVQLKSEQFADGLLLCFLMGLCEGYFVPLGNIFITPNENTLANEGEKLETPLEGQVTELKPGNYVNTASLHKLHNVNVAFGLMEDAGIQIRDKVRAEDVINADSHCILRILFTLYLKYKDEIY